MPTLDVLKTLNYVRQEGSTDYQDRIPLATRTNITEVGNAILEHKAIKNEFIDAMINKVAITMVSSDNFEDPFKKYEGEPINFGDTVEDIFIELTEGEAFQHPTEGESVDPYTVKKPNVKVLYHSIDRELTYTVTVFDDSIRRAFQSSGAFQTFLASIVATLEDARQYDRYTFARELLSNETIYGSIVELGEKETAYELAGHLIGAVKNWASKMEFMRKDLNKLDVKTYTKKANQLLIIREDVKQAIDLQVLSEIFNITQAELETKLVTVDAFSTKEQIASLVDMRGFRIHTALTASDSTYNGKGRYTNYFVHDWSLYSWSLYRNAIMIKGTTPPVVEEPIE